MSFMISLFGSEQTGKPKVKCRLSSSKSSHAEWPDRESRVVACGRTKAQKAGRAFHRSKTSLDVLPPEDDEGNVEYKLKMVNPSASRFQHLVTQMKWRLREGQGEAIYEIGVEDDGVCVGLTDRELEESLLTLGKMVSELNALVTVLRFRAVGDVALQRRVVEVLVRKVPDNQQFIDLRVAVLGNVDAGKSTLLGVLTQGEMDNGRGKSRLNLFRHLHEVKSGRTSSISTDILGFDSAGNILNYRQHTVEEICDLSTKLITFIDLAGHQKYMKTTIIGLTGYKPHYVALVIAANAGLAGGTTHEHLAWASALQVPLFVVMTKIDVTPAALMEKTLMSLEEILKQRNYLSIRVRNDDDALTVVGTFVSGKVVPIFTISSVTGENLNLLQKFFNVLPQSQTQREREDQLQEEPVFEIDEIFNVSNIGLVTCGLLSKGIIRENDPLLVGPGPSGEFREVIVESLQRNRTPCRIVQAGQAASVAIGDFDNFILRKGMVLISPRISQKASFAFEAEVYVLYHSANYIAENFQATVHIGNVCQTAILAEIRNRSRSMSQDDTGMVTVLFVFLRQPEFILEGSRLLFRQGSTKGIGHVTSVCVSPPEKLNISRRAVAM